MKDKVLRILVVGAHQDDPEKMAGTAAKFVQKGHVVRFLCATNGQSGHQEYPGYKTVQIRMREAEKTRALLGLDGYDCLDINDGYLMADIPSRERMMRAIRTFAPDMIFTHRPYDYHPDHRNTALLVQDCSYLMRVPNFLPTVPVVEKLPYIFYMSDHFQRPYPFAASVAIDIDDMIDLKIDAFAQHESQMFEWLPWVEGMDLAQIPAESEARRAMHRAIYERRLGPEADRFRTLLMARYGEEKGRTVRYCEAFEACEYGASHAGVDYAQLFPF